jgi:hypothetical protein
VADVLPAIGPSWAFSIQTRDPEVSTSFPVDSVFSIELQSSQADATPNGKAAASTEDALDSSLRAGLGILAAVHNAHATGQKVSIVKQRKVNGTTIHFADPVAFFQPSFAIADGRLVLATAPELCESFLKPAGDNPAPVADRSTNSESKPAKSPQFGNLQNLMASSIAIRKMLTLQRDWFIRQARKDNLPEADAEQLLEQLDQVLSLLDRAWMTANVDASTLRVSAGIAADSSAGE